MSGKDEIKKISSKSAIIILFCKSGKIK